jgi:hypothetical protein
MSLILPWALPRFNYVKIFAITVLQTRPAEFDRTTLFSDSFVLRGENFPHGAVNGSWRGNLSN